MKIAVAGTGYVGLSLATLLAQHNKVTAVDVIREKVDMINKDGSKHTVSYKQFIVCPACTRQVILDSGIIVYKKEI